MNDLGDRYQQSAWLGYFGGALSVGGVLGQGSNKQGAERGLGGMSEGPNPKQNTVSFAE